MIKQIFSDMDGMILNTAGKINTKTTGPKYCEITSCKAVKRAGIKYIKK